MARSKGLGVVKIPLPEYKDGDDMGLWAKKLVQALSTILADVNTGPGGLGWAVTNLTTKTKALDATGASASTVRTVLASLIKELKDSGRLSN